MATYEEAYHQTEHVGGVLRPKTTRGLVGWLTTVDHKRIGILYGISALFFFIVGGIEALLIRLQLAGPNLSVVGADRFNELFTMHGTTMIFLAVMPLSAAFFNYLVPLMIGARDVAFPRLNAFSYWLFLLGGILINTSWFLGDVPNGGWFGYANLSSTTYSPGFGMDFWVVGLQILGVASLAAGFNFIVTILNMRAPGMSLMRMPIFVWTTLVTQFLIILSFPAITVGLILLMFDRMWGTNFFEVTANGDVILWQHLFWIFGHPEVYILILPAMGIISEVLPTFSRKPLFGYPVMVFSTIIIAFLGFAVWVHHMFTVGLGPVVNSVFALTTMAIAIPTGIKIFNWLSTLWGGSLRYTTSLMFALGFIWMFMIGGFSGVMHAAAPADAQQQDTYFVVAHFHYVLIGGSLFALVSGLYYWFPKVTGRKMSEKLGKLSFWLMFVGFNIAFFPMHFLGLMGMPRRIYTYDADLGLNFWNQTSTVGAFVLAFGVLFLLINLAASVRSGERTVADPWDARTLEWAIPSPVPVYNFAQVPHITDRDELWERKQTGAPERETAAAGHGHDHDEHGIHMPGQSYFPLLLAIGITIMGYGFMFSLAATLTGAAIGLLAILAWAFEGIGGYHIVPEGEQQ